MILKLKYYKFLNGLLFKFHVYSAKFKIQKNIHIEINFLH